MYIKFITGFTIPCILLGNVLVAQSIQTAGTIVSQDQVPISFSDYFIDKTLRIDYLLGGNHQEEIVYFAGMKQEPFWGGPHKNLVDLFNYGTYRYCLYDSLSGRLLFLRGFGTLFQEWEGTPEALTIRRTFPMTAVMPFPKRTIRFVIEKRANATGKFEKIFELFINPVNYFIVKENIRHIPITRLKESGEPGNHVDIAFIAEGYTMQEMGKFRKDAARFCEYFLKVKPFSDLADKFNFYAVESPSEESGVSIPGKNIYVNTSLSSSFYTFDMDRYLTTSDTKSIYDIAANVPYDIIFVLVNSQQYGGGGFYNHYGESTVDHRVSEIVAMHEFGHTFAGLADEYYTNNVTNSDFYNPQVEPWEANITTNVGFTAKWKKMILPGTPVPTPRKDEYKEVIGMFEGGGYVEKGVYSPMMDCRMKSNEAQGFCPVCQEAIRKMILFYCD